MLFYTFDQQLKCDNNRFHWVPS